MTQILFMLTLGAIAIFGSVTNVSAAHPSGKVGTVHVDDSNCPGPGTGTSNDPFCTIQAGVNHARTGDKVKVAPGTYSEAVTVNKTISLRGAQSGNPGTARDGAEESVVGTTGGAFRLTGNNILLDGFTIRGVTNVSGGFFGGVITSSKASGYKILNNIIENNVHGLFLNSDGVNMTLVRDNLIRNNNNAGPGSRNGLLSSSGLSNTRIQSNTFNGHRNAAILMIGTQSSVRISGNTFVDDSSIVLFNTTSSIIDNNQIMRSLGSAILLGGGVDGLQIKKNTISGGPRGIRVGNIDLKFPGANRRISIAGNLISDTREDGISLESTNDNAIKRNTITGNTRSGVRIEGTSKDNVISGNVITGNKEHDLHDETVGDQTALTANVWKRNTCATAMPVAACETE